MAPYISGIVLGSIAILIAISFLIYFAIKNKRFENRIKEIGQKAEDVVNADIKIWSKKTKNLFLPASIYKYGTNKVFEVDSIIITSKVMIVVEIKSIKGGIKGDAESQTWTKVLGDKQFPITNPIVQNDGHIDHLVKMMDIKVPTVSLIIYSNRAKFLDVHNIPSHAAVIRHAELFDTLDQIEKALPIKISTLEMHSLASLIKNQKATKTKDQMLHKKITRQGGK